MSVGIDIVIACNAAPQRLSSAPPLPVGPAHRPHPRPGRVVLPVVPGRCGGSGRRRHPGRDVVPADRRRRGGGRDRRRARHPERDRREGERHGLRGAAVCRPWPAGRLGRDPGGDAAPPRPGRGSAAARTWRTRLPPTPRSDPSRPPPGSGYAGPTSTTWCGSAGSAHRSRSRSASARAGHGAVDVALYATASVDAVVPAHPEVDWEQLRTVEKGRRSPLAALQPAPA